MDTLRRRFVRMDLKQAVLRVCSDRLEVVREAIGRERERLEAYIRRYPGFATALTPLDAAADAPAIVRRMADAGRRAGGGTMAAVAGAMAQAAGEAAVAAGAREAVIDNGGDVFIGALAAPLRVAIGAAGEGVGDRLAFLVRPRDVPLAVCASSGVMGHSFSRGRCELAVAVARDAALADAVATLTANGVRAAADIEPAMRLAMAVGGVDGVLVVMDGRVGLQGRLPELVRNLGDTAAARD